MEDAAAHDRQVEQARLRVGAAVEKWEQASTLAPPPFAPGCDSHELAKGLAIGDVALDGKHTPTELLKIAHGGKKLPAFEDPPWVDHAAAARGQAIFQKYYFAFQLGLFSCLTSGFSIGRFSDVLVLSGYAKSPLATYYRFNHTAKAVHLWVSHPLDDPDSPARQSLIKVRCLHAYARQRAAAAWAKDPEVSAGAGVPLSQFDMAQVQMAFSSVLFKVVANEMGCYVSAAEEQDLRMLWRYIGWHLGILDTYNVCESPTRMRNLRDEFFACQRHYARSLRPSTAVLVESTLTGFARYTGTGRRSICAFLSCIGRNRPWYDSSFLPLADRSPVVEAVVRNMLPLTSKPALREVFNARIRDRITSNNSETMLRYCLHPISVAKDTWFASLDLLWRSLIARVVVLVLTAFVVMRRRRRLRTLVQA